VLGALKAAAVAQWRADFLGRVFGSWAGALSREE
jgi:hypothetical protein